MNELIPWLQQLLGPDAENTMLFLTDWAGPLGWWIAIQLVFIFAGISRGMQLAVLASIGLITNSWLKWIIAEPRPFLVDSSIQAARATPGFGMPSGHAQGAATVWGALAWQSRSSRLWATVFVALFLVTGISRIYLGVHSPAQVLVGWVLGLLILVTIITLWPKLTQSLDKLSWIQLWSLLAVACIFCVGLNSLILHYQASFVVPELWLQNQALTQGVDHVELEDLGLLSNRTSILVALAAGFCAIGIMDRKWPIRLSSLKQKLVVLVVALVSVAILMSAGANLGESFLGLSLLAFIQPLACIFLPMRIVTAYVKD